MQMTSTLTVADFFKPGGYLEQVKPGFRQRQGQSQLSELIYGAAGRKEHVFAEGPTGFGKCVTGDTLITMADGTLRSARSLPLCTPMQVLAWDNKAGYSKQEATLWRSSVQPCFELKTKSGRMLCVSQEHPCWTAQGWVQASKMQPGFRIAVARNQPHGTVAYSTDWAWLVGLLIGDGGLSHGRAHVTIAEEETVNYARIVCERLGFTLRAIPSGKYAYCIYGKKRFGRRGTNSFVVAELTRLGLMGSRSETKRIPSECFTWNAEAVASLLDGYFQADGGAEASIEYNSVCKELLEDVRTLLLRFGITSWLREKKGTYLGQPHKSWRLLVSGSSSPAFVSLLSSSTKRVCKAKKLAARTHNDNIDLIPEEVIDRCKCIRGNGKARRLKCRIDTRRKNGKMRSRLYQHMEHYPNEQLAQEAQLFWDEIVSVTPVGLQQTYSIEVQEKHTHITNDFITHNSLALLVPAILYSIEHNKRVVVSTHTNALLDQYLKNDLPLLQKAFALAGVSFTFAGAKGRSNYVCRNRLKVDENTSQYITSSLITQWVLKQVPGVDSGDISTVPGDFVRDWREVAADEDCERRGCAFYVEGTLKGGKTSCFVMQARKNYLEANIVITNHTMLLLDRQRCDDANPAGQLLGPIDMLIVDEGHTLAKQAQGTWGEEFGPRTISRAMVFANRILTRLGVEAFEPDFQERWRALEDKIFAPFAPYIGKNLSFDQLRRDPNKPIDVSREAADVLLDAIKDQRKAITRAVGALDDVRAEDGASIAKEKLARIFYALQSVYLGDATDESDETDDISMKGNWLSFIETNETATQKKHIILKVKPIEVGPLMRIKLFRTIPTVVIASATLRVQKSFWFIRNELGAPKEKVLEFVGKTPFDYQSSVEGYFPTDLPAPPDREDPIACRAYYAAVADRVTELIEYTGGGALVLCTSRVSMDEVFSRVSARLDFPVMKQSDAPKHILTKWMKEETHGSLFGLKSYFTGVDIAGDALRLLILLRAPFEAPDPMTKAREEKIKAEGQDSFRTFTLPYMLMELLQGFGRLIRTETDTGVFALLDSRANTKNYGKDIIAALPPIGRLKLGSDIPPEPLEREDDAIDG